MKAVENGVLEPGRNCWRIRRAGRFAVIVDAAAYFRALREAMMAARHTVYMIGWDFDTRIRLTAEAGDDAPVKLGKLLNWAAERRPDLNIHVLKWDAGLLFTLGRGSTPLFLLDWMTRRNISFKLDGAHPGTSAHHQKIVVIDDVLAFCGGIDVTGDRWDTREHADHEPGRVRPTTHRRYDPWHDATTAVDGEVAKSLGELARARWKRATGEDLPPPPPSPEIWPGSIRPALTDVEVAIARTLPAFEDQPEVREIERLYLDAIASARRSIYLESQYFASRVITEALCRRLSEPDGPEIVVVNPESAQGWLEEAAMGSARVLLLKRIADADRHNRFRIYTPVTEEGQPIYVHAKILVVDDRLLRIGSSNLNNRSMGFDTECDLAIEAIGETDGAKRVRKAIAGLRSDLLAEHLGCGGQAVDGELGNGGSLIAAIERLRGERRSLRPFEPPEVSGAERELADRKWLDPEGTARGRMHPSKLIRWRRTAS